MSVYTIIYKRKKVSDKPQTQIKTSQSAMDYAMTNCYDKDELWREKVYVIYMDKSNNALAHLLVSVGGYSASTQDIRLIIKGALDAMATKIVLLHNHPSGNPNPSTADIQETDKLKRACSAFDIELTDHIVIGEESFFSFHDEVVIQYHKPKRMSA